MAKEYLVFDVGGTTIKYGLLSQDLKLHDCQRCSTEHNHNGHILAQLKRLSAAYQQNHELAGIGVSTAGIVGADGGIQYAGPTIADYQGTPIKAALKAQTQLPVSVVNDVDAALLGEQLAGSVQKADAVYCVALGTGIGGAYLNQGQLLNGAHATANSLGYTLFDVKTQTNYEQRASTLALEATLKPLKISVPEAFARARQGEAAYLNVIKAWAAQVAAGLAQIMLLFDPEVLLIGGAVSQQGDFFLTLLKQQLKPILPPNLCQTQLKVATLADKAQLYGAAAGLIN